MLQRALIDFNEDRVALPLGIHHVAVSAFFIAGGANRDEKVGRTE
jgi:hypothetical protein